MTCQVYGTKLCSTRRAARLYIRRILRLGYLVSLAKIKTAGGHRLWKVTVYTIDWKGPTK